ncbi:MAG: CAP domain-containing protein, partial [Actinomycetota bacterium]|nr:CAP domain-containing protein [Actinomycetota bacterium]
MDATPDDPRRRARGNAVTRRAPRALWLVAAAAVLALCTASIGTTAVAALDRSSTRPAATGAAAVPDPGSAEADFTARINGLRASKGLGPLAVDGELVREARSWATTMAGEGRIFHTSNLSNGITADWVKLGENVGVGADVAVLFQAFIDSPTHYANLVDPKYTTVGVGVVVAGDRIFTAHRFMAVAPPAPAPPPPPAPVVTAPPVTAPPVTAPPTTAAPT